MRVGRFLSASLSVLAIATLGLAHSINATRELGRFAIGTQSHFEYGSDSGLVQIENGERLIWALPAVGDPIQQIEFGSVNAGFAPFTVTESGTLYRGDSKSRSWAKVTRLPGVLGTVSKAELLVADIFQSNRLFWAFGRGVWVSTDAGESWSKLAELPDTIHRLVYSLDRELVAFTRDGHVVRGRFIENTDRSSSWDFHTQLLPVAPNEDAFVLENGGYLFADSSPGANRWRVNSLSTEKRVQAPGVNRPVEFASTKATNIGCIYQIYRYDYDSHQSDDRKNWTPDNYWDMNSDRIKLRLDMRLSQNTNGNQQCVWLPAFDPHRMTLGKADGKTPMAWGSVQTPGEFYLWIEANGFTEPQLRAVAFNVWHPDYYKKVGSTTPETTDTWAIIVQNSQNSNTACSALQAAPKSAPGRLTLKIGVVRSDRSCPTTSTSAIACTSPTSGASTKNKQGISISGIFGPVVNANTSGATECSLPDL